MIDWAVAAKDIVGWGVIGAVTIGVGCAVFKRAAAEVDAEKKSKPVPPENSADQAKVVRFPANRL